ncbi:hypothetical protein BLX41_11005 [Pseudomonas protegens]|nr:hypothetical protein BLX41_11005 [Pseudomonas protegens]
MSKGKKPVKARDIPENSKIRDYPAAAVVAYCYQSNKGPAFVTYKGRQSKPSHCIVFPDADYRDRTLADYVAQETEREDFKRARLQTAHELVEGDIMVSVWGYEQTNASFFQVVRVPSDRGVVVRLIRANVTEKSDQSMTGHSEPKPGEFDHDAKEEMRRATGKHPITAGKRWHGDLHKWDGKPVRVTFYG